MRFLFVGNSTYMNHGSEAIVRGTVAILRKFFDSPEFISAEVEAFPYANVPERDPGIVHRPVFLPKPYSFERFYNQARKALITRPRAYKCFVREKLLFFHQIKFLLAVKIFRLDTE